LFRVLVFSWLIVRDSSEFQSQGQLRLPRRPRIRDLAVAPAAQVRVRVREVDVVERVEQIRADLDARAALDPQILARRQFPRIAARPLNRADAGVAAAVVGRRPERRGVEPAIRSALGGRETDLAAGVVRAPVADQRVACRRQVLPRLPQDLIAELPAAERLPEDVAPLAHPPPPPPPPVPPHF